MRSFILIILFFLIFNIKVAYSQSNQFEEFIKNNNLQNCYNYLKDYNNCNFIIHKFPNKTVIRKIYINKTHIPNLLNEDKIISYYFYHLDLLIKESIIYDHITYGDNLVLTIYTHSPTQNIVGAIITVASVIAFTVGLTIKYYLFKSKKVR